MSERTIVITGASDGIGAAAARELARTGDRVVVVGRSAEKTRAVAAELGAEAFLADFARLDDVRELADRLLEAYPRIDVLANNAGGIMGERADTVDGHEKTFQVNHLAPFLLTTLLLERLIESSGRVIATSSVANSAFGHLEIDDLDAREKYSTNKAYGDSKLANILFTKELDTRYADRGLTTASFHPGGVATNFAADSTSPMRFVYNTVLRRVLISPEKGADTLVWLATSEPGADWVSGEYYVKRKVAKANPQAYDADLARELWDRSAAMVG
ncbi:short-chain dehydrogenase (plasmid) [Cellulomonas sp. WB94]|uniref:SDR family NAD(P)-dependent oxidoreductase n=1 Tax=Cellulomonas sp. WB94 TaxID=2173174 RepID=UPI000D57DD00|nr:SDR family NAD(P)-dependent oxidoreductase [Cellulomonas sp. WB94]PVU84286.1 short-chain dehydrogenase [Cellulomonas sp. WB94]